MDVSQVTSASLSNPTVQGVQGHHHHRKSMTDQLKDMQSAIDNAVKAGQLTSDQASAMTKELDDVKATLSQAQSSQTGSTDPTSATAGGASTSPTGGATQLSASDRDKVRKEMHDVGKQLFQALNPQSAASSTQQSSGVDAVFKALDTNGDGNISKDELSSFFTSLTSGTSGAGDAAASNYTYSGQATMTMIQMQSSFSVTA